MDNSLSLNTLSIITVWNTFSDLAVETTVSITALLWGYIRITTVNSRGLGDTTGS